MPISVRPKQYAQYICGNGVRAPPAPRGRFTARRSSRASRDAPSPVRPFIHTTGARLFRARTP